MQGRVVRQQRQEKSKVAEALNQEPPKKPPVSYSKKNYEILKKKQEDVRRKQEEENRPPSKLFKLKRFEKVESVFKQDPAVKKSARPRNSSVPSAQGPVIVTYNPEEERDHSAEPNMRGKDYVRENVRSAVSALPPKQSDKPQSGAKAANPNYGKVPEYIENYKLEKRVEDEMRRQLAEEMKAPEGMRLLSDEERLENLAMLEKSRDEVFSLINKLPIAANSLSIRQKRTEYENKLNDLEQAIKNFSRKKVYVEL
mmetsp:Transcript_32299/g.55873  ORF Transcript_32299/g.55873 Transcript_32299/m.55873 type:complete len:255 (+) Transcript_32299:560-1324(+)